MPKRKIEGTPNVFTPLAAAAGASDNPPPSRKKGKLAGRDVAKMQLEYAKHRSRLEKVLACMQAFAAKCEKSRKDRVDCGPLDDSIRAFACSLSLYPASSLRSHYSSRLVDVVREILSRDPTLLTEGERKTEAEGPGKEIEETRGVERRLAVEEDAGKEEADQSLLELDELLKEIDLSYFSDKTEDTKILQQAFALAVKHNQIGVMDKLIAKKFDVAALAKALPCEIVNCGLSEALTQAKPATLMKLLLSGFNFTGILPKIGFGCYLKAIEANDIELLKSLFTVGQISLYEEIENSSILKHLLFNGLSIAKEIFSVSNISLEITVLGKHPFLIALEMERYDVAQFIARRDILFKSKRTRSIILSGLLSYVQAGNVKVIKFCVEDCGFDLRTNCNGKNCADDEEEFRYTFEYFELHVLIRDKSYLLAHAIMWGHQSLIPFLKGNQDNVSKNLQAYVEHTLSLTNIPQMKKLREVTQQFIELGADINFNMHPNDDTWLTSPFARCIIEILDDVDNPHPSEIKEALLDYMIFLVERGADLFGQINGEAVHQIILEDSLVFPDLFLKRLLAASDRYCAQGQGMRYCDESRYCSSDRHLFDSSYLNAVIGNADVGANRLKVLRKMCNPYDMLGMYLIPEIEDDREPEEELSLEILQEIIALGADLNAANIDGKTFLNAVLSAQNIKNRSLFIKLLLENAELLKLNFLALDRDGKGFFAHSIPYLNSGLNEDEDLWTEAKKLVRDLFSKMLNNTQQVLDDIFLGLCCSTENYEFVLRLMHSRGFKFDASRIDNPVLWKEKTSGNLRLAAHLLYHNVSSYKESELVASYTEEEVKEIAALNCSAELNKIWTSIDFSRHLLPKVPLSSERMSKEVFAKHFQESVISAIRDRPAIAGVPKKYLNEREGIINPEFTKFHDNVYTLLQEFLYNFIKKMVSSTDKESENYQMISELFYVFFGKCGGQWEGGLGDLCIAHSIGHADFETALRAHYSIKRNALFKATITEVIEHYQKLDSDLFRALHQGSEVHLRNYLVRHLGLSLGIPRSTKTTEDNLYISRYDLEGVCKKLVVDFSTNYYPWKIKEEFDEIFSGKHSSHLFDKEVMTKAIGNKLLGEWKLKEYAERVSEIKEKVAKFFAEREGIAPFEVLWPMMKREAQRCEIVDRQIVTIDDKQIIIIDFVEGKVKELLKNSAVLSKADVLTALCKSLDFAGEMTRQNDFNFVIFNEDGSIKSHMALRYLCALNLVERNTALVDWSK